MGKERCIKGGTRWEVFTRRIGGTKRWDKIRSVYLQIGGTKGGTRWKALIYRQVGQKVGQVFFYRYKVGQDGMKDGEVFIFSHKRWDNV